VTLRSSTKSANSTRTGQRVGERRGSHGPKRPSKSRTSPWSTVAAAREDGNLTGFHRYQLEEDPNLRMGFMSTKQDGVGLERLATTPEDWEAQLLEAVEELEQAHPDRFRSFVADGDDHTFVIQAYDREVGGTTARAWIGALNGAREWASVSD